MIVQKNFLSKLRDFGLNTYESKLWTALLSRGQSTAGELSDIANVPRSRTYDVLESLERKGFILRKLGKPIRYIAVPPEEVINRVKIKVKSESDRQLKLIEEIKKSDVLDELMLLHAKGVELIEPTDLVGSINGRDNIHNHIESRLAKSTKSISFLLTPTGLERKSEFLIPIFKKLKNKNISIKIATNVKRDMKDLLTELSKYAEIRHTDIKGRFCVIDGKEAVFMLLDDSMVHPSYDTAVWINTQFFAETLEKIFQSRWQDMKGVSSVMK